MEQVTFKTCNTNIVLIWRLIIEQYGPDIEYIKGGVNIVADTLSILPFNDNEETTQKPTYHKEIVLEINDIEEIPEGTFPINL